MQQLLVRGFQVDPALRKILLDTLQLVLQLRIKIITA
jgi:hypothetical protein